VQESDFYHSMKYFAATNLIDAAMMCES
jgi:hypothetical protein